MSRSAEVGGWLVAAGGPDGPPGPDADWIPAVVPGGVHESLIAAGRIPHPYRGRAEADCRWVEDRTWWYRTAVEMPSDLEGDERLRLELTGLDGVAAVWLDGELLLEHANQHRPAEVAPAGGTRSGGAPGAARTAELLVRFAPPLEGLLAPGEAEALTEERTRQWAAVAPHRPAPDVEVIALQLARPRRRKATFSWGWDFAPRVPSIGIAGPVRLHRDRVARIAGVGARTFAVDVERRTATVVVTVEVERVVPRSLAARVTLTDPVGRVVRLDLPLPDGAAAAEGAVALDDAHLWWTHDLGEPALHRLDVELLDADPGADPTAPAGGARLDVATRRIGVRTVELDRSPDPDEGGRRFRVLLNGVPTFARGANWVPASMLVGSVDPARVRRLVEMAREGEMTMLRIWGGGVYEQDAVYDACDELGVLVWQDFMFACYPYPSDDPALAAEVEAEAAHQVRRLRTHPCIALWGGGNEVHMIRRFLVGDTDPGPWGWSFFHELLPAVVEAHAPGAPYWPESPWGEPVNGVEDGDRHAWEVWHGIDVGAGPADEGDTPGERMHPRRYERDRGRFISEFGLIAAPEVGTLERWADGEPLELGSPALLHRIKDQPQDKVMPLLAVETGLPTTYRQLVEFTMAVQAEGLKLGVEHHRRRQPTCGGTLVWQLDDAWPGITWSVIDHDLVPKAAYHVLRRAYAPVVATFRLVEGSGALELWVTNSGRTPAAMVLDVDVTGFDGDVRQRATVEVAAAAGSSAVVWRGDAPAADAVARVVERAGRVPTNRRFAAPLKALPLTGTVVAERTRTSPTTAEVRLTSTGYSYLARVRPPLPEVVADSGYVDLRDGESHVVRLRGLPPGFDLDRLEAVTFADAR